MKQETSVFYIFVIAEKIKNVKKIPATPREPQSAFLQVKVSIEHRNPQAFLKNSHLERKKSFKKQNQL